MKIGLISDTHDDITYTNKAIDIFEKNNVFAVIHAGDIISPPVVKEFKRLTDKNIEFYGILGNNDGEVNGLKRAFEFIKGSFLGDVGKISIGNKKFGIYHGTDEKKKNKMINSEKFDVFVYGHTHRRDPEDGIIKKIGRTVVLNPGSAHSSAKTYYSDPPYFRNPSVMIYELETDKIEFFNLSD